ncbi:hypothetical protein B0A52_04367 [Exophiala mesophila]|uniref:MINDY deubiquitinase domain-containing protein n=1 Tax=Exophiala mesophila TaxID=212818 RepID=A0A438N866_EXOME|nr:hypothetical protein B0A52_04367 [Exophiala mesophila]
MVARKTDHPLSPNTSDQPAFANYDPLHEQNLFSNSSHPPYHQPYQDQVNPWSDAPSHDLSSDRPVPDILRPGSRTPETRPTQPHVSLSNVPDVLRSANTGQSRDTPRSSFESDRSRGFWEDSDDEQGKKSPKKNRSPQRSFLPEITTSNPSEPWVAIDPPEKSPGIKRKPVGLSQFQLSETRLDQPSPSAFASNNPFRTVSQTSATDFVHEAPDWGQDTKGKAPARQHSDAQLTDHFQDLNIGASQPFNPSFSQLAPDGHPAQPAQPAPPMPQAAPPPPPLMNGPPSPFSQQPPLIPVITPQQDLTESPWAVPPRVEDSTPSPIPFAPSQKQPSMYNDNLLDRGQQNGTVSLQNELSTIPNAATTTAASSFPDEPSLLEDEDDIGPPLPIRPNQRTNTEYFEPPEGPPPPKPPRPTIRTTAPSSDDLAKMREQRNETYQVKHFNWFDHNSRRLRTSSMLTQNKNGPCPLLALVNALILGAKDESQASLDDALRSREQVTLGLIIETLMDELLSRGLESVGEVLPDVDELNAFLLRLRTGMNANPRFVAPVDPPVNLMDADDAMINMPQQRRAQLQRGGFESTIDMKLYGAFNVPLVHGWLPDPGSDAEKAFRHSAPTYEDAQALQFGEEELEYKLTNSSLTPDEQNMWQNIQSIKAFLSSYPTQLTPSGLKAVQSSLPSGSFAIMFRNDHFSTIYKHPESGQLFTLITDAGYADRDEIIWESLVDISGSSNEFFSGDFMPVSHNGGGGDTSSIHPTARRTSQFLSANEQTPGPMSPQERQEQHDADFAMALQLQEEEEQRQRAERNRRRSGTTPANNTGGGTAPGNTRRQSGNIPIPLRSQAEARPSIPPRVSRANIPAVNRPADADSEDAPPAYEEAAKGTPYIPPVGSPLHPHADPSPMNSQAQLTGTISNTSQSGADGHPPGPHAPPTAGPSSGAGRRPTGRRTSAYHEQTQQQYSMPQRTYGLNVAQQPMAYPGPSRRKEDRDCIVM